MQWLLAKKSFKRLEICVRKVFLTAILTYNQPVNVIKSYKISTMKLHGNVFERLAYRSFMERYIIFFRKISYQNNCVEK